MKAMSIIAIPLRILTVSCLFSFITALPANADEMAPPSSSPGEYMFSEVRTGPKTTNAYFDSLIVTDVFISNECGSEETNKDGKKCRPVIKNSSDGIVHRFLQTDTLSFLAKGRYKSGSYILVNRSFKCGDKMCEEITEFDQNGRPYPFIGHITGHFSSLVTKDRNLCMINGDGVTEISPDGNTVNRIPAPEPVSTGFLSNNPDGGIAAVTVTKSGRVMVCNMRKWIYSNLYLTKHGDRSGIFGCYPVDADTVYCVVYRYVNEYNKGLYAIKADFSADFSKGEAVTGLLFNSEKRNIGFNPDIHAEGDLLVISSRCSSEKTDVHFEFPASKFTEMKDFIPEHAKGFENEKSFSFLAGGGVGYLFWLTHSRVEKNNVNYMDATYTISNSINLMGQFEARYDNTDLTVSYLKEAAGDTVNSKLDSHPIAAKASRQLLAMMNINGFFPGSSSLRLQYETSELNGVAEITQNGNPVDYQEFQSKYEKYAGLVMMEKGLFGGIQYIKYRMPVVLGFDSGTTLYPAFDDAAGLNTVNLVIGYDMLSYCKRYETNYNNFYFAGYLGFGIGWLSISDSVKEKVEMDSKKEIDAPLINNYTGEFEVGYFWQIRSKKMKGLGFTVNPGYRVRGTYMGNSRSTDSTSDKLTLEFSKYDIFHGPFINAAVIF